MRIKHFRIAEISGVFIVTAVILFLRQLYVFTDGSAIGVVFGSVNESVWEKAKVIPLAFFAYALAELMCVKPYFRNFVAAKAVGLCAGLSVFIFIDSFFGYDFFSDVMITVLAVFCAFLCSYLLTVSRLYLRSFFVAACLFMLLVLLMTFSFTVFPPQIYVFRDPYTGCFGIIPRWFDKGAVALGNM